MYRKFLVIVLTLWKLLTLSAQIRHAAYASQNLSVLPKLGVLAGRGDLPEKLIRECRVKGREVFVIAFKDEANLSNLSHVPHAWVDVTAVGQIIQLLRDQEIKELVLLGPVGRPDFKSMRPNWHTARLLPKIISAARKGDDAIFKVIVAELERQGFRVIGAQDVLSSLKTPSGVLGSNAVSCNDEADIKRGIEVIQLLGQLDIGQAVVVRDGYVLAVEAAEGTDQMLKRCKTFRENKPSGVLIKFPKPNQERRVDLPTIGVETLKGCIEAGLRGIALESDGALIDDIRSVVRLADEEGLFIVGLTLLDYVGQGRN